MTPVAISTARAARARARSVIVHARIKSRVSTGEGASPPDEAFPARINSAAARYLIASS